MRFCRSCRIEGGEAQEKTNSEKGGRVAAVTGCYHPNEGGGVSIYSAENKLIQNTNNFDPLRNSPENSGNHWRHIQMQENLVKQQNH